MLIVPTMRNWRAILLWPRFRPIWTEGSPLDKMSGNSGQTPPDPELVRRAVIVLEDYLLHVGYSEIGARIDGLQNSVTLETPPSSKQNCSIGVEEAREILGLEQGATAATIRAAHHRLLQLVHPIMEAQIISPLRSTEPRRSCWRKPLKAACVAA